MRATRIPRTIQNTLLLALPVALIAGIWAFVKGKREYEAHKADNAAGGK